MMNAATRILFTLAIIAIAAFARIEASYGLSSGNVTITAITPFAPVDSNNCSAAGPHAMYLQVNVTNATGAAQTNVQAVLNGFPASAASPPNPPTAFTLDLGETQTRFIGTLAAGATAPMYWYVNYPCTAGASINYTVTVSDSQPGTVTSSTLTLTARSELSAQAGGDIDEQTIEAGLVIGQTVKITVHYLFGNPASGADAMVQPAGNVSFNGGCFRLTKVDVTASTFSAGPITTNDNRLYFTSVNGSSSNTATVDFYFDTLCTNSATTLNPFADLKSGGQSKYSGNFGSCTAGHTCSQTLPAPTNPFSVSKSVSPTNLASGGTVTYTVTVTNTSDYPAKIEQFTDVLPVNATYGALTGGSTVQASNSASIPSTGATGTITWVGQPTDRYAIAAHTSLQLIYTAVIPATPGLYTNNVSAEVAGTAVGSASASVLVGATPTPTQTNTSSPTATATMTSTFTPTATSSNTPTNTATITPSTTPSTTPTSTPTNTSTSTPSSTQTATPTNTQTSTPSHTATDTPTNTPTSSNTPTNTATNTPSSTATATATATSTETPSPSPSETPTETHTATATVTASDTPTETPTETPTDTPTETPTEVPSATASETPVDTPTPLPTETPTDIPSLTPTETPTETAEPTATASETPTETPVDTPSAAPTDTPTETPSEVPSATPSQTPSDTATEVPSATPSATVTATVAFTATSTTVPTASPTASAVPTHTPTPTTGPGAVITCPPVPVGQCRTALPKKSVLAIRKGRTLKQQRIMWRWKGERATDDLGDPALSTGYAFCLYDYTAGTPHLIYGAVESPAGICDGKPCWHQKGDQWFVYRDPERANAGVKRVSVRVSQFARTRFVASGPDVLLPALPLRQDPKVTAQMLNSNGECWGSDFNTPALTRARGLAKRFRDRN